MMLWHFLYLSVSTHQQAPYRQLGTSFLGSHLNKFDKSCIFLEICFMLKDHQKPYVDTRYKENLIRLFTSSH